MREFFILTKNYINNALGVIMGKKDRSDRQKNFIMLGLLALGVAAVFGLMCFQASAGYAAGASETAGRFSLFFGFINVVLVVLLLSVLKISGFSYTAGTDADLLLSLPLKKSTIVFSKTIAKYFFDLMFVFVLTFPQILMYLIYVKFSVGILLAGILLVLLLPFISVGIGYIFEFIVSRLFNKSRFASVFKSVLILLFLIGFLIMNFVTTSILVDTLTSDFASFDVNSVPVISWMVKFVIDFDLLSVLYIVLSVAVFLSIGLWLFTINFGKNLGAYKSNKTELDFDSNKTVFSSLFSKEMKRYLGSPIYFVNTIFGPIIIIVLTVMIAISGPGENIMFIGQVSPESLELYIIMMFGLMSGMSCISCSSISLEGKNIWILRSNPVNEKHIFLSKALLNIVMVAPVLIVCSAVVIFVLNLSLTAALALFILPLLINIIISFGGLFINLLLPKLDWQSEMSAVKNSASMMITILFGMIIGFLPLLLDLAFGMPFNTIIIITISIQLLLATGLIAALFTKGKKLFRKL